MKWLGQGLGWLILLHAGAAAAQPGAPPAEAAPDAPGWEQSDAAPSEAPPGPYYTEPPPPAEAEPPPAPPPAAPPPPAAKPVYEPPPPGAGPIFEPPPPPEPHHVAPKAAIWLGGRVGFWSPFGALWAQCTAIWSDGSCAEISRQVPIRDFVHGGASFEGNAGIRFQRRYVLYGLWERAQLSGSDETPAGPGAVAMSRSSGGDTDFFGGGMRVTTDPDTVGLLVDLALGYRQMRARWQEADGLPRELRMTGALDFRMGIGADLRLGPSFSLTPLASLGVGTFSRVEWISQGGTKTDALGPYDLTRSHAWFSLAIGGHFDLTLVE